MRRSLSHLITALLLAPMAVVAVASPATAASPGVDTPGVIRNANWYLSNSFGGNGDFIFGYGNPGDLAVVGDWNGDGIDTPGVVRNATWYLSDTFNATVDYAFGYGNPGDIPVVGDWNGDGRDTIGVMRGDMWYLTDGLGGDAGYVFAYGIASDQPVVGDWNNDGRDTPGVVRDANWFLSDSFGGNGDHNFNYGLPGDLVVGGDWNGDGTDTPGVVRGDTWFLSDSFGGNGDHNFAYGIAGDLVVAGHWGGTPPPPPPPPDPCPFAGKIVTYNPNGWGTLLDAFAANPTPCVQYYITLPAITTQDANNKLFPRGGAAVTDVRSRGSNFHPIAEFHWGQWSQVTNLTWFEKGVEFRRRMTAAGYDQSNQETWAVNELPSTVRTDSTVRQNVRDLVRGLYQGPSGVGLGGAVFIVGLSHATTFLSTYKTNLKNWDTDTAFWNTMNSNVRWWGQEVYESCAVVCVAGASVGTMSQNVNDFIEHPAKLASAGPAEAAAAKSFFNESYMPLTTAFWKSNVYGGTQLSLDNMKGLVSLEVYAARAWAGAHAYPDGHLAFAWNESTVGSFPAETRDLAARIAAAVAGAYGDRGTAAKACSPSGAFTWCSPSVSGAAFNAAWNTFETW